MSLATRSFATVSLATIVLRDKFYEKLKHKKPRIIIQIRDLRCLLGLVFSFLGGGEEQIELLQNMYICPDQFFLSRPVANILRSKIWEVGSWEKLRGGVLVWIIGKQTGNKRRSGLGLSRQTFKSVFYCEQLPVEKCSPDDIKKSYSLVMFRMSMSLYAQLDIRHGAIV